MVYVKILNNMWIFAISVFLIVAVAGAADAGDNTNNLGVIEIDISPVKDVYYADDEINVNFIVTPNKNGCFVTLLLTKINGTIETLFRHETGCKSCGLSKPPLREKMTNKIKKKFDEPGIYEIQGMITDACTYQMDYKTIKIIVKDAKDKNDNAEKHIVKDAKDKNDNIEKHIVKDAKDKNDNIEKHKKETESENTDENNTLIPVVIEVFTNDDCSICYHVDKGAKKLADEYNKRTKNSIIILEYHLADTQATHAGIDRRKFYGGDEWQNTCNYYALTLFNGEDENCGGTHNTESNYANFKNKVKNKNLIPTVNMRANASRDNISLYVDVKIKTTSDEAKNSEVYLFILDDTNVRASLQKPAGTGKNNEMYVKFSFPYNEISAYRNLKIVALIQKGKKILNARVIELSDIQEIKILKEAKELKKNITEGAGNKGLNMTGVNKTGMNKTGLNMTGINMTGINMTGINITAVSESKTETNIKYNNKKIKNQINFMYCMASRDTLYCAILNLFGIAEIKTKDKNEI